MASRLLVGRCVSRWLCASTRVAVPTFRRTISIPTCYVPNKSSLWSVHGNSAQKRVSLLKRNYAAEGLTVEELQERLLNTIKLFDKVNPEKVHMDAHFINDLGLDSLDVVEIVMFLEDEFDVEITDEEAEKIFILKDAFELLKTKKSLN